MANVHSNKVVVFRVNVSWVALFPYPQRCNTTTNDRIYNYNATILEGSRTVTFSDYRGKSVLFVNVATYWGYTYQYVGKKKKKKHRKSLVLNKVTFAHCFVFVCLFFSQNWMHYMMRWNNLDSLFLAFPPTNLGNRNQERSRKSYLV